ncbi:hypothetical protein HanRHA438_Chr09g0415791 [Helianthus annuus]|nr:hypothetical protein HanRHA438_Chr09g0415791 [Helianthus annuus]
MYMSNQKIMKVIKIYHRITGCHHRHPYIAAIIHCVITTPTIHAVLPPLPLHNCRRHMVMVVKVR